MRMLSMQDGQSGRILQRYFITVDILQLRSLSDCTTVSGYKLFDCVMWCGWADWLICDDRSGEWIFWLLMFLQFYKSGLLVKRHSVHIDVKERTTTTTTTTTTTLNTILQLFWVYWAWLQAPPMASHGKHGDAG